MRYLQDLDLWLRMMWYDYEFVCLSDLLVVSRVHKNQTTNLKSDLFDVDRAVLAEKHVGLLRNTKVEDRVELLKVYLLFFEGESNTPGIEPTRQMLRNSGYKGNLRIQCLYRKSIGKAKHTLRKLRDFVLKLRNLRN